jgi:endonuclease III
VAGAARGARLSKALEALAKVHGKEPARNPGSEPLDHLVYGILAGNGPGNRAREAYDALAEAFVDRNELRVATTEEIVEHLGALGDEKVARARADLLRRALQALFDSLDKVRIIADTDDAAARVGRILGNLPGLPPGLAAAVVARSRPEPVVRPNAGMLRVAQRLGVSDRGNEAKQVAALEAGAGSGDARVLLHYLLTEHAETHCHVAAPKCDECPAESICDFAKKKK